MHFNEADLCGKSRLSLAIRRPPHGSVFGRTSNVILLGNRFIILFLLLSSWLPLVLQQRHTLVPRYPPPLSLSLSFIPCLFSFKVHLWKCAVHLKECAALLIDSFAAVCWCGITHQVLFLFFSSQHFSLSFWVLPTSTVQYSTVHGLLKVYSQ